MAQVQFCAGIILVTHLFCQSIHFLRQNSDAAAYFIVTHFRNQHLFADLITVGGIADAIMGQTTAHLIHAHVVLLRDVSDRLIELRVTDFHPHFLTHLQDNLIHDQTFQDLVAQRCVIRKLLPCFARVELYRFHQAVNVTFKYDAVVNHSGDFINNLGGREAGIRN